ncbi:MAG: S4 domain-containing protein [Candidatus Marsarchaeota archaeon]|nr:S4 domain-containing protein [Candidatus Marsarchaeota archaeon]
MARHGNSRHLNRLAASTYARVSKKTVKYLAKPASGRHALERSVALSVLIRDKLGLAANAREARKMIKAGQVRVNGTRVADDAYPVGLGDVIAMAQAKEAYSIGVGKNGDIKVEKAEPSEKGRTVKVVGKYLAKGSKTMLRLYDGSLAAGDAKTKVNDSAVVEGGKIKSILKFERGARCLVVKGAHASETGTIKEIKAGGATAVSAVKVEGQSGTFETPVENVMVIGE